MLAFRQHLGQPRQGRMTATLVTLYTVAKVPFIRDKLRPSQLSSYCSSEEASRSLTLLLLINYSTKLSVCLSNTRCGLSPPRSLLHRIITNVPYVLKSSWTV